MCVCLSVCVGGGRDAHSSLLVFWRGVVEVGETGAAMAECHKSILIS